MTDYPDDSNPVHPLGHGWAFPGGSRKAHWFAADKRALCGRWSCIGMPAEFFSVNTDVSKEDCTACRRRLDAELAKLPSP